MLHKKTQKAIAVMMITFALTTTPLHRAHAWMDAIPAELIGQAMDVIETLLWDVLKSAVEAAALQKLTDTLDRALGLDSSPYIANYADFLFTTVSLRAKTAVMGELRAVLHGIGNVDYIQGNSARGSGKTYADVLRNAALVGAGIIDGETPHVSIGDTCTFDEFGNPEYFGSRDNPNVLCLSSSMLPNNNPISIALNAQTTASIVTAQEQKIAEVQAQSNGIRPKTDDAGNVTAPAALVEEILTQKISAGITQVVTNHDSKIGQKISALIVSKLITKAMSEISDNVSSNHRNYVRQLGDRLNAATEQALQEQGPEAEYDQNTLYDGAGGG